MSVVTLALWLPISRANFFSMMSDRTLMGSTTGATNSCSSPLIANDRYVPRLRSSVVRRLLEVLPRSFGYDTVGSCGFSHELDEISRPVTLTMTLHPATASVDGFDTNRAQVNRGLIGAGVDRVDLQVDENGSYTFTATLARPGGDAALSAARNALARHVVEVFGGDFRIDRLKGHWPKGHNEGAAAVRRYNGLSDEARGGRVSQPKGVQ